MLSVCCPADQPSAPVSPSFPLQVRLLDKWQHGFRSFPEEQYVLLTHVLAHDITGKYVARLPRLSAPRLIRHVSGSPVLPHYASAGLGIESEKTTEKQRGQDNSGQAVVVSPGEPGASRGSLGDSQPKHTF